MKIQNIIEQLTTHEIAKWDAIKQLSEIVDGFRSRSAIEGRCKKWLPILTTMGTLRLNSLMHIQRLRIK